MIMYLQRGIRIEAEKGGSIRVISPGVAVFFCLGVLVVLLPDGLRAIEVVVDIPLCNTESISNLIGGKPVGYLYLRVYSAS